MADSVTLALRLVHGSNEYVSPVSSVVVDVALGLSPAQMPTLDAPTSVERLTIAELLCPGGSAFGM